MDYPDGEEVQLAEPAPAGDPPQGPLPQSIPIDVWMILRFGAKHVDQGAGFKHWARQNGRINAARIEWDQLFDKFMSMPAGRS